MDHKTLIENQFSGKLVRTAEQHSYSDAFLRSLGAILGSGNVGWSRRSYRSERIFLFSAMIFGLFFNIYCADELFATQVCGREMPKMRTLQELFASGVEVHYDYNLCLYTLVDDTSRYFFVFSMSLYVFLSECNYFAS